VNGVWIVEGGDEELMFILGVFEKEKDADALKVDVLVAATTAREQDNWGHPYCLINWTAAKFYCLNKVVDLEYEAQKLVEESMRNAAIKKAQGEQQ
jgi:hypothetical protein